MAVRYGAVLAYPVSISLGALFRRKFFLSLYFFSSPFSIFNISCSMFYSFGSRTPLSSLLSLSLSHFDNFWMSPREWIGVHAGCASTRVREKRIAQEVRSFGSDLVKWGDRKRLFLSFFLSSFLSGSQIFNSKFVFNILFSKSEASFSLSGFGIFLRNVNQATSSAHMYGALHYMVSAGDIYTNRAFSVGFHWLNSLVPS
jgi:hypothetical protein